MLLRQIGDPKLAQYAYLIGCQRTGEALIIDPERDIDRYVEIAREEDLHLTAVAETHIHADFLSGARELAETHGTKLYLSAEGGPDWQYEWTSQGDYDVRLLRDGDRFTVGGIEIQALHTPGHTPEHLSFIVTDRGGGADEPIGIASGDFVFVGDLGRPDLLESAAGVAGQMDPSARRLYRSIERFLALPDYVQVWPAHGAGSACGKALGAVPSSTVGYEKRHNAAIDAARRGEEAFVESILGGQPEPPLYFATMKRLNKEGAPVLGELPKPRPLEIEELQQALADDEAVVVDTRLDRTAFMDAHLAGSLYAPYDRSFPTIVGSYVRPEEAVVLVIDEAQVEAAIRDLVRIGFDRVGGFITPER
ncbi:MAG: MBL fold metallo-hydrolase, partial [Acidobacteriota bacterium]